MTRIYRNTIILMVCAVGKLNAQTVNTGDLVIMPRTEFSSVESFDNTLTGNFVNDGVFFVYANFNNDGMVTFSQSSKTGLTYFKGITGAQTISGTLPNELNDVRFDNTSAQPAFLLSGELSVKGTSYFNNGIVDNDTNGGKFIFGINANHNDTSHESYVLGHVEQNGKNEFQFPVGDEGFFRPISIGQSTQNGKIYTGKYYYKNSNGEYPHDKKQEKIVLIDSSEYWKFETTDNPIDFALTLTWDENTTPNAIITGSDDDSIAIVKWHDLDKQWKIYDSASDEYYKTVTAKITSDGIFTLARIKTTPDTQEDNVIVYNGFSPNEDGVNDYFFIDGLSNYPNNTLEIYNRWGVKVFETSGYGTDGNWFKGISEGRATVSKGEKLSTGTYFYVLRYKTNNEITREKVGYLYFN